MHSGLCIAYDEQRLNNYTFKYKNYYATDKIHCSSLPGLIPRITVPLCTRGHEDCVGPGCCFLSSDSQLLIYSLCQGNQCNISRLIKRQIPTTHTSTTPQIPNTWTSHVQYLLVSQQTPPRPPQMNQEGCDEL